MNDCTYIWEMLLKIFVLTDAGRERKNHKERVMSRKKTRREKMEIETEKRETRRCVFSLGATEGIVFPPWPLPGPSQKPPGVPGFLRKNISAPITPEPSAGLFTLAWLPDSFTDVTYRHTGTLSQKGSRSTGRGGEEQER